LLFLQKKSLGHLKEIYNFFNSEEMDIKINPVDVIGRSSKQREKLELTPFEYGVAMNELFDIWYNDRNTNIVITNLMDAMRSVAKGYNHGCLFSEKTCGTSFIGVTPFGDVYPCNRFSHNPEFKLGNVLQDNLEEIFAHSVSLEFRRRASIIEDCQKCSYKKICNSGCPSRAYSEFGIITHKDYYCNANRMIFAHVEETLRREVERRLKK
jgi:uncharacterized protein